MSKRSKRFSTVLIASCLFAMSAWLPTGPAAGSSEVVVEGYTVDGTQIAVTMTNHGSSHKSGQVLLMVSFEDGSIEQVAVRFSLNGGATVTYTTSADTDVTGAVQHGIIEDNNPM